MERFELFIFARTIHILSIVLWIGGVAFVTSVLIPSIKAKTHPQERLELFEQLEGRFSFQAKAITLLAGLSGFYMLDYMNAWARFYHLSFWWLHLMVLIWLVFTLILFVLEPFFLHQWFRQQALKNSQSTFEKVHLMHKVLLTLSLLCIAGAVAGSHGYSF